MLFLSITDDSGLAERCVPKLHEELVIAEHGDQCLQCLKVREWSLTVPLEDIKVSEIPDREIARLLRFNAELEEDTIG
ncbi:MAG: hypothetical protein GY906_22360 [bacterium]|nr:hypothetical protein [bacterium]